jgi:hypothetical protein
MFAEKSPMNQVDTRYCSSAVPGAWKSLDPPRLPAMDAKMDELIKRFSLNEQ